MDHALDFAISGFNMDFIVNLAGDGHSILDGLFMDIMTEKCGMIRDHIQSHRTCLILVANTGPKVASVKLSDINIIDSQLLHITISNVWDLDPQLYRLWIEVTGVLKDYIVNAHLMV